MNNSHPIHWEPTTVEIKEARSPDVVTLYIRQRGTIENELPIKRGFKIEFTEEAWKKQMQFIAEHGTYPQMQLIN